MRLRFPGFQDIQHLKVVRLQPYTPAAFAHQEIPLVFISVRHRIDPRDIERPEGQNQ